MGTQQEANKAFVLEYMDAFGTLDPDVYDRLVELLDFRIALDKFDLSALGR